MGEKDPTILVVDDDRVIVELATTILGEEGYTVLGTTDPEEAILLIERNPSIDLLISDVMIGNTNGPEVVRRAQRIRRGKLRVLFMTGGYEGVRFRQTDRILPKPWSWAELAAEVQRALSEVPQRPPWRGKERRSPAA